MMKRAGRSAVAIIIAVIAVVGFILFSNSEAKGPHTEYQCDVKSFSLSTKIDIDKEGKNFVKVRGNLFRFITDPLTMYDLEDNKIAYAGDAYHFITQDSHSINVGDTVTAEMVGLFDFFGESYDIYNANEEQIAEVSFNMFNTKGEMYDMDGNIIADFYSKLFFNYKCQYINEQKIKNKNVQNRRLCNLSRFIFYFFYFVFYSIGSTCNVNNMRVMQ